MKCFCGRASPCSAIEDGNLDRNLKRVERYADYHITNILECRSDIPTKRYAYCLPVEGEQHDLKIYRAAADVFLEAAPKVMRCRHTHMPGGTHDDHFARTPHVCKKGGPAMWWDSLCKPENTFHTTYIDADYCTPWVPTVLHFLSPAWWC